jgi:hypothetical protein
MAQTINYRNFPISIPTSLLTNCSNYTSNLELNNQENKKIVQAHIDIFSYIRYRCSIWDFSKDPFCPIEAKTITKKVFSSKQIKGITYTYSTILNNLIEWNYIETPKGTDTKTGKTWKPGERFIGYRINYNTFMGSDLKTYDINIDKIFLEDEDIKSKSSYIKEYPTHKKLIEDIYNTSIDLINYERFLLENLGQKIKSRPKQMTFEDKKFKIMEEAYIDMKAVDRYIFNSIRINFKMIWIKVAESGRLYSSFTNLSSTHIPFINYKNRELYYLDAKNCQPLLLSSLIKNDLYKKDVEKGIFYEKVCDLYNKTFCNRKKFKKQSRNSIKSKIYQQVLFNDKRSVSKDLKKLLDLLYGKDLVEQINNLKAFIISKQTQTLEAEIFVEMFKDVDFYCLGRHDGIFTDNLDKAEQLIKDGFYKLGLNVEIDDPKIKVFNPFK